jgi:hypothetical protein
LQIANCKLQIENWELQMERTGWSRAYFTVAGLAVVLVPLAALTAAWTTAVSCYVTKEMRLDAEGVRIGLANLGTLGFIATGVVCWVIVGAVARFRDRFLAVAVATVALIACVVICMAAVCYAWEPFLCITWRLT